MKTKKTALIFLTDVIPLIIISILGIFKFKLFLQVLGDETLGLYQLFSQIMIYVALVDGGLSNAVLFSLYKPNAEENKKKFNALLAGAYKIFKQIGMIVFSIASVISLIVPFLIKDSSFNYWYITITFILFSTSNAVGYFFVPYHCLLEVKEKKYIYNLTNQIGQIVLSITEIIFLLIRIKFEYILIMHTVIKLLANLVEMYICKKQFPDIKIKQKEKDYSFKVYIKSLIFHKINGLIGSNIDTIIISSFLGLKKVAIYSTYIYIINMLESILGKISTSMTAIIGNYMVKSKDKLEELRNEFNGALFFIAIVICTPLTLAINGFINIFYEGKIATSVILAISFTLLLFVYLIKMSTTLFINAGGLFKETQHCAMIDTCINLILSLVLINYLGIPGVLIATVVAVFIAEYILKTKVLYKHIFNKSPKKFFINNIKFFIIYIIDLSIGFYIINLFKIDTLFIWFIIFTIYTIINSLIILLIFSLFKETKFIGRFKYILKKEK